MTPLLLFLLLLQSRIPAATSHSSAGTEPNFSHQVVISPEEYQNRLYGFWLGESIANWTGLVTEMDKIGNIGEIKTGKFYTRDDWGKPDQPNIWNPGKPSDLSPVITFVYADDSEPWGSDDDTDIEYLYQSLLDEHKTSLLTPDMIRDGWLRHIRKEEENFLWVSNQKAFDLMQKGMLPPATSDPDNNPESDMIDAQLTTEIFGLFAPARPDVALEMARLPIRTTASREAVQISEFYVILYSLASAQPDTVPVKTKLMSMANQARKHLPDSTYPAKMFDFVKSRYQSGIPWEQTRDEVYDRYQVRQEDGYTVTSRNLYCNGCFAAGINFAASLISYFYGEGDIRETIKIGVLTGWDSDNPTATWGGLLGFMNGRTGIEKIFGRTFSGTYNIHRTRINFSNGGIDSFSAMAKTGADITERTVLTLMNGSKDPGTGNWVIPVETLNSSGK